MVAVKLGLVLQSNEPETVWNAIRFANTCLDANHTVQIFLLGKGVEVETIRDSSFDVQETLERFVRLKGEIYACGTCLEIRKSETKICPVSTMTELLKIVEKADKVLVF